MIAVWVLVVPDGNLLNTPQAPKVLFLLPQRSPSSIPSSEHLARINSKSIQSIAIMPLSGHCLCKAVTYTVDIDAPLLTGYDHCDDCQRQSGSTYCTYFSF